MSRRSTSLRMGSALLAAGLVLAAAPAFGAGFGIFEQGSKAMGMAGAFTAQADDGSAMYHNPAGLAFQKERSIQAGFTWIRGGDATFRGAAPFPGTGVSADQETLSEFPPHVYWVEPINDRWTFGLAVNAPFGLTTEWSDDFVGRFVSRKAALRVIDLNPTIAWQVNPDFGIAVGAIARFSDVELIQHVPALNPFTNTVSDVGVLTLDSPFENGYGFTLGILHKYNNSFSWGLSYRSKVEVDYSGDGSLVQNFTGTPFDQVVPTVLPFGESIPVETGIDFPDQASLGLAFAVTPNVLVETDFNWTGWSSFDQLTIDFTRDQLPDTVRFQKFEDVYNYRIGLRWDTAGGGQWRFGYVFDETPQPEAAVSPLLPDADRNGFTIGYGWAGQRTTLDLAFMYLQFEERTRGENFPEDGADQTFFGTYENEGYLFGLTLGF